MADRYTGDRRHCHKLKVWSFRCPAGAVRRGHTLRVQAEAEFRLRCSRDGWVTAEESPAGPTALGIWYVDLPAADDQRAPLDFTFFWPGAGRWEGRDFRVEVQD